jgi:RNA polymerase sigma factor (TIGR02999 family)
MSSANQPANLTVLLDAWRDGDADAFGHIIAAVQRELGDMARGRLRGNAGVATMMPSDLLQDALVRVMQTPPSYRNGPHFMATMSLAMRSVLIDHARSKLSDKRGGGAANVTFTEADHGEQSCAFAMLALDEALIAFEELDPRAGQVLHLTYFGGLSREDIADVLGISVPTVDRELKFGRAWVERAMSADTAGND